MGILLREFFIIAVARNIILNNFSGSYIARPGGDFEIKIARLTIFTAILREKLGPMKLDFERDFYGRRNERK